MEENDVREEKEGARDPGKTKTNARVLGERAISVSGEATGSLSLGLGNLVESVQSLSVADTRYGGRKGS